MLHYYKSTIDGVMTSLIDTFFNLRRALQGKWEVQMKIVCPELYLMDNEDFYNFDLDDTQWYEYTDRVGLKVEPYKANDKKFNFHFKAFRNEITTAIPFLRFNRNFGDFNLLHSIEQKQKKFKDNIIVCSARLIYEILMGADIELECNKLLVLDSLDTYKSKIGMFPDFDDLFDTMFKNAQVIQLSNPATFRETKYDQREYYHKLSYRRLNALKQSGHLKDEINFKRTRSEKGDIGDGNYFENIGKQLFEHLYFQKKVNYFADGAFTFDGMWFYLNKFGIDGSKDFKDIKMPRSLIKNHLFMKNIDELLKEST